MLHFLSMQDALEIHRDQLRRYGGAEGIRDMGLLSPAMAMPRSGAFGTYLHADVFEMAAAYLFHVARNHPFVDGNKRAAAMCAFVFLRVNGTELTAPPREFEDVVRRCAQGALEKPAVAAFLRKHARRP